MLQDILDGILFELLAMLLALSGHCEFLLVGCFHRFVLG